MREHLSAIKVEELHRWFQNAPAELRKASDEGTVPTDVRKEVADAPPDKHRQFVKYAKKIEKAEPPKREGKKKLNASARKATGEKKPAKPKKSARTFTPANGLSLPSEKIHVTARLGGHTESKAARSAEEIKSLLGQVEEKLPEVRKPLRGAESGTPARTRWLKARARLEGIAETLRFVLARSKELPI